MIHRAEEADTVDAARGNDEAAFTELAERHRRELKVHCYRMVASFEDAEDLVQETLLRAWQKRESFEGRSSFRTWLYRIATNACLDFIEQSRRRVTAASVHMDREADPVEPSPHVAWLQPYPDRLLDVAAPTAGAPDAMMVTKETIELAFLVAVQLLPPRQRAVLIVRDVLEWSARETADLLDTTTAAVNAALLRARATVRKYRADTAEAAPRTPDERERELVRRFAEASDRGDVAGVAALLREDARFAMPPDPDTWVGREEVLDCWVKGGFGTPKLDLRCVMTSANRMPAGAFYHKKPGDTRYRPLALDVLDIRDGGIAEVTAFPLEPFLEAFGLPETL